MIRKSEREENPFEDKIVAAEWISSVEGEKGLIRDNEIYPMLEDWASGIAKGTIVEIGSGQGICSEHLGSFSGVYIGIEPSEILVARAKKLYGDKPNHSFIIGNAYDLSMADESADACFSVNVWFHLADLKTAAEELSRVLKSEGKFIIITANPEHYKQWRSFYQNPIQSGKLISGKVHVPVNPLTRNDLYMHTLTEITGSLKNCGLSSLEVQPFGSSGEFPYTLFISIKGVKR